MMAGGMMMGYMLSKQQQQEQQQQQQQHEALVMGGNPNMQYPQVTNPTILRPFLEVVVWLECLLLAL